MWFNWTRRSLVVGIPKFRRASMSLLLFWVVRYCFVDHCIIADPSINPFMLDYSQTALELWLRLVQVSYIVMMLFLSFIFHYNCLSWKMCFAHQGSRRKFQPYWMSIWIWQRESKVLGPWLDITKRRRKANMLVVFALHSLDVWRLWLLQSVLLMKWDVNQDLQLAIECDLTIALIDIMGSRQELYMQQMVCCYVKRCLTQSLQDIPLLY